MKKFSIAVVVMLVSMMLLGITGCSSVPARANTGDYNIGDAVITETVENIKIDWSSGKVNFVNGSKNEISFSAIMPENTPEEEQLHWRLDGTTLYIWDRAPQLHPRIFNFSCGGQQTEKELTVTVPEMMIFSEVNIDVSSAEVNAPVIKAADVIVSTSSGSMNIGCICTDAVLTSSSGIITANCTADKITASSSSGKISLDSFGNTKSIELSASSGSISVSTEKVGKLSVGTSSGTIDASADAEIINMHSSSGRITCTALSQPAECSLSASSGDVTLYLPADANFTANIDRSSGGFDCDFPVVMQGDDRYVCGDGSAKISIDTSSGDIEMHAFDEVK